MAAHHFYGGHIYGTISMVCSCLMHTRESTQDYGD
jgi:hypothetical protein